jgi:hypothetical protein
LVHRGEAESKQVREPSRNLLKQDGLGWRGKKDDTTGKKVPQL